MPNEKPALPEDVGWPEATVAWFAAWCESSRTDGWDAAQWQYMFDTALAHASVWGDGNSAMLGELRARLTYLGLSFDASQPIIQYVDKEKVTPLDEIRARREKRTTPPRRSAAKA